MPGKVKVRVVAGRNLPVMDRSSDTTDAFAEVKLGDTTFKTDVCRKTLHPNWNSDWFRFDVDDRELQDEPLQIRIMDYDTYSANDAIGKVYIDLNPLVWKADVDRSSGNCSVFQGWLPIFDTLHGTRGEVSLQVKVELFSDLNKFRTSSCGVLFFCSAGVPEGYQAQAINGFVAKLVVNDDPEYQWIDKIRTPRASNEARQALFMKLSSTVKRKMGLMALEVGGNAVLGYEQKFDLEGDTGIVVRAIGTAVTLVKQQEQFQVASTNSKESTDPSSSKADNSRHTSGDSESGYSPKNHQAQGFPSKFSNRHGLAKDSFDVLEYPFLTLQSFPDGFLQRIGGFVSCRSVKLLENEVEDNKSLRESWWQELRLEVRSHARSLSCNVIAGYSEITSIYDDVVVLSASGTAVWGNLSYMLDLDYTGLYGPPFLSLHPKSKVEDAPVSSACSLLHVPSPNETSLPTSWKVNKCCCCGKYPVPDVIFTTIEPPVNSLNIVGRGGLIQAKVLRLKKDQKSETNAKEISDALPFIEYEMHRQLYNKLKVKGMNAIFGLRISFSMSARVMVATATGTGVFLAALPPPNPPRLVMTPSTSAQHKDDHDHLSRMQKRLVEKISENADYYGLKDVTKCRTAVPVQEDIHDGEPPNSEHELITGNKDTCVLEIDDAEDADILESILDRFPPIGFQTFSTEELIGIAKGHIIRTSQMFVQVWRGRIAPSTKELSKVMDKIICSVFFKLRRLKPCLMSNIRLKIGIDEENEVLVSVTGIAIGLAHDGKTRGELATELVSIEDGGSDVAAEELLSKPPAKWRGNFFVDSFETEGVLLTPTRHVPGAKIDKYLGNINYFLIRETSSLREAGGLSNFVQSFICEINAIVRAHVLALGGNALVGYFMSEFVVMHNPHKNQAQCLIHIGGDSVQATYHPLS